MLYIAIAELKTNEVQISYYTPIPSSTLKGLGSICTEFQQTPEGQNWMLQIVQLTASVHKYNIIMLLDKVIQSERKQKLVVFWVWSANLTVQTLGRPQ